MFLLFLLLNGIKLILLEMNHFDTQFHSGISFVSFVENSPQIYGPAVTEYYGSVSCSDAILWDHRNWITSGTYYWQKQPFYLTANRFADFTHLKSEMCRYHISTKYCKKSLQNLISSHSGGVSGC